MVAMRDNNGGRGSRGGRRKQIGNGVSERVKDVVKDGVKQGATEVIQSARQGARSAAKRVRKTAGELTDALRATLQDEAEELYERHKGTAVSQVERFGRIADQAGHALHAVKADTLAQYLDRTADRFEDAITYLKKSDLAQLMQDGGRMIRRNRGLAMGGMFVAGYVVARFIKATDSSNRARGGRGR